MAKISLFGIIFFTLVNLTFPAVTKTIHGYIRDAKTKEILPIANIQVVGTYRGTISNDKGKYNLDLQQLPATIRVRYIGYKSKKLTITKISPDQQNIELEPVVIKLKAIVVTGEDPAVNIMRKVIRRKQEWRAQLATYQAEAYTRLVLENDTSIVSIAESISEIFWQRKKGPREIIKSKRETANIKASGMFASASYLPNFYDDDIKLEGFEMIGPTHPDAVKHYHFKLEGRRYLDDKIVYDISLTPKSKFQAAFVGHISVLDEEYALLKVDLKPSESIMFPPPIHEWNLFYQQQFSNFEQTIWLPVDVRIGGDIKISMIGLEFPRIKYNQISRITNYQVNVPLPDSLYREKKITRLDSIAIRQDTLFTADVEIIPLTENETEAYSTLDSTMTLDKAFKPTGVLAKMIKITVGTEESADRNQDQKQGTSKKLLSRVRPQLWHNRVDGFNLGLKFKILRGKRLKLNLAGGYKTDLKRWTGGGDVEYRWGKERHGFVKLNYLNGIDTRLHSDSYNLYLNSLRTLFGLADYFDYYWNEKLNLTTGYRIKKIRTRISVGFNHESHESVAKTTDYDLSGRDYFQRLNPNIQPGRLRSVEAAILVGYRYIPWGIVGQNRIELKVEHSAADWLASDFSFTRYRLTVDCRIPTFYRRRFLPNVIDLRMVAGTAGGELPVQRSGAVDVSLGAFSPFGVFKSLRGMPLEGEKYLALFWEHNFRTIPFEVLGLRSLAKQGIGIVLFGASGRTWRSDERRSSSNYDFNYMDTFHHEIGLSLNSLFGFLRLDLTKNLDNSALYGSVSMARAF